VPGASFSIVFEYEAADCQFDMVAFEAGHMPPKKYICVCEAFACTKVEKLMPFERKAAPGTEAVVVVFTCAHTPLPSVLVLDGVNRHSADLVEEEQDPV
jgi:hypothetical protein